MIMEIVTHYGMLIVSGLMVMAAVVLAVPTNPDKDSGDSKAEEDNS